MYNVVLAESRKIGKVENAKAQKYGVETSARSCRNNTSLITVIVHKLLF